MAKAGTRTKQKPFVRRKRGFESASKLIAPQLRGPLEKRGFSEARLITHWAEIVGEEIAGMAVPVRVRYARNGLGATLVLLAQGASAPLVEMQKQAIRDKVNACHGYNAIQKVQITQTSGTGFAEAQAGFAAGPARGAKRKADAAPDPQLQARARSAVASISDPGLKAALERLAQNVFNKAK